MSLIAPYIDTSALAKYYLPEPGAEEFAAFAVGERSVAISRLALVEFRCLLARRLRAGELAPTHVADVTDAFARQIAEGHIEVYPLDDRHTTGAIDVLDRLADHPLRTLDALHLAIALDLGAKVIATADRIMAGAAAALGFDVKRFGARD